MKAIVANVLFGGIFGCLGCANSTNANPLPFDSKLPLRTSATSIISTKLLTEENLPVIPQIFSVVDRMLTLDQSNDLNFDFNQDTKFLHPNNFDLDRDDWGLSLGKLPFTYQNEKANLVLGFQNTFWSGNSGKYWGLTAIEQWGQGKQSFEKLPELDYFNSAPILSAGTSALTLSGGGNNNLAQDTKTSSEFQQFRGGIAYHRGIADEVTLGVGFVYENLLVGFTQLTYKSDTIPVKTTVSLRANESGLDIHSHIHFQPVKNITLNYYSDQDKQRFNANWNILPGLDLIAKSNTKNRTFSTGLKIAIHSNFVSLSADAALDSNNNLQWNLKSRIGGIKFSYGTDQQKSTSDLSFKFLENNQYGVQCSAFVKYQNLLNEQNTEEFTNWGTRITSATKVSKDKHQWTLDLGYGSGSSGKGFMVNSAIALRPNMFLNLTYQEISPTSDDTKLKFLLSSK